MTFCRILVKKTTIPKYLLHYVDDDDLVFEHTDFFILVNDDPLELPYVFEVEKPIVRLDKRVLRDLSDEELSVLLFRAKIEQDVLVAGHSLEIAIENADHILVQRYAVETLDALDAKLGTIFDYVV